MESFPDYRDSESGREEMEKLEKGMLEAQKEKVIDYLVTALL